MMETCGRIDDVSEERALVIIESGLIAGYVISWVMRKATRVAGSLDSEVDHVIDASMDRLHDIVVSRLGDDTALVAARDEAGKGQVSELTHQRLALSVQAAATVDPDFAAELISLVDQLRTAESARGPVALGLGSGAVAGSVTIHADGGSAAAWHISEVSISQGLSDPR